MKVDESLMIHSRKGFFLGGRSSYRFAYVSLQEHLRFTENGNVVLGDIYLTHTEPIRIPFILDTVVYCFDTILTYPGWARTEIDIFLIISKKGTIDRHMAILFKCPWPAVY